MLSGTVELEFGSAPDTVDPGGGSFRQS